MTKSKKILGILVCLLLIACAVGNIYVIINKHQKAYTLITALIAFLAILAALYYAFRGYAKNAAPAYKTYMILCALHFQSLAADLGDNGILTYSMQKAEVAPMILISCLLFGLMLLLSVAKDLGKGMTRTISIISLVAAVAFLVVTLFGMGHYADDSAAFVLVQGAVTGVLLVFVAGFMAELKYIDKEERGTK